MDGRSYWALSPGLDEREAAIDLLAVSAGSKDGARAKGRTIKGKRAAEEEERKGMKRWSWFVAVWGKRPDDADVRLVHKTSTDSDEDSEDSEEEDDGEEKWWGFWEPEEIRRLAAYVGRRGGLGNEEGVTTKSREEGGSGGASAVSDLSDLSEPDELDGQPEKPSPSMQELKELMKGLKERADLLEWRIRRDESEPEQAGSSDGGQ